MTIASRHRSRLGLQQLDSREVPATLNAATGEVLIDHAAEASGFRWIVDVRRVEDPDPHTPDSLVVSERQERYELSRWWSNGGTTSTFSMNDVQSIRILLGREPDEIALHTLLSTRPVTVAGGWGNDRLTVDGANTTWAMSGSEAGTVNGFIQFSDIEYMSAGSGNDTVDLSAQTAGGTFDLTNSTGFESVSGGAGSDTLKGYGTWTFSGTNCGFLGSVWFNGIENLTSTRTSNFVFSPGRSVTGTVGGTAMTFDYSAYSSNITVDLGARKATAIGRLGDGLDLVIGGTGSDRLTGGGYWEVTGSDVGRVYDNSYKPDVYIPYLGWWPGGSVGYRSVEYLKGSSGNDAFVILPAGRVTGGLSASDGTDTLDYSKWTSTVNVDLGYQDAEGLAGIDGFEIVLGGSAGDVLVGGGRDEVLVGNGGNDRLDGNGGRDILIGGIGIDSLSGGSGDDVLIAGSTNDDSHAPTLARLRSDWVRTDRSYTDRCNLLAAHLTSTTVTQDADIDQLTGGADRDWFWARYFPFYTLFPPANQDNVTDWVWIAPIDSNTLERLN